MLDELLDQVTVQPDRLVVAIHGAPPLNVILGSRSQGLELSACPSTDVPFPDAGRRIPRR